MKNFAQVLKDTAMATAVGNAIKGSSDQSDKFLVVAGSGHIDYRLGSIINIPYSFVILLLLPS